MGADVSGGINCCDSSWNIHHDRGGAFIVLYSFIIGRYVYKALDNSVLWDVLKETINDIGVVMLLIMSAAILGHITILDQIPQQLAEMILEFTENKYGILFYCLHLLHLQECYLMVV